MKRQKNGYLVEMVADGSGEIPKAESARPVFVLAWTYREAVEKAVGAAMAYNQFNAKLTVTRLRPGRQVDHVSNPWRDFYVNRVAVIRRIDRAD